MHSEDRQEELKPNLVVEKEPSQEKKKQVLDVGKESRKPRCKDDASSSSSSHSDDDTEAGATSVPIATVTNYPFKYKIHGIDRDILKQALIDYANSIDCTHIADQRFEDFRKWAPIVYGKTVEQDARHPGAKKEAGGILNTSTCNPFSPPQKRNEEIEKLNHKYHKLQGSYFKLTDELPKGYSCDEEGFLYNDSVRPRKKATVIELCTALIEHNVPRWKDKDLNMTRELFMERFKFIYNIIRARYDAMELTYSDITRNRPWMDWVEHYNVVAAFSFVAILMDQYSHTKYKKGAFQFAHDEEKGELPVTNLAKEFSEKLAV